MNRQEAIVGLNMVDGIGSVRLSRLLELFNTPQNIFNASIDKLKLVAGLTDEMAGRLKAVKEQDIAKEINSAQESGIKIVSFEDDGYPENLKQIPGFPIMLYVKGRLLPQDKNSIAVVGSRRASFYGLSNAERFSAELSEAGFTIISGMARGVDTYAHRGALKKSGRTIAVMGSGFNNIYPAENKKLAEEIAASGAVISEFSMDTQPLKHNFPRRNRIISGLSLGTLVVEAARNSGALITADFALEQNRDVFALPGKIDSGNAFGTNELIKQGAKLVSSAEEITEEYGYSAVCKDKSTTLGLGQDAFGSAAEAALYGLISHEPLFLDDIIERANLGITAASSVLLQLQLKKLVKQLPGKQFVRNQI